MNILQLDEFEILNYYIDDDDNRCFDVVPVNVPKLCPYCHEYGVVKNGTIDRMFKDLKILDKYTYIIVKDNRFKCPT